MKSVNSLYLDVSAIGLLAAVCMPACVQAASAQIAEEGGATRGNGTTDNVGLQEIIVTAQRRSENLQKVPIAVAVATADQLKASGVSSMVDLKVALPGVDVQRNNGFALPIIRGIAFKGVSAGLEPSVAIYVDDVYIAAQTSTMFSLSNIAQVEALKGPQGTLFGRNTTAGLLQVKTRDPGDALSGNVSLSYGNYDTIRANAYVGGPLSDTASADIAMTYSTMGEGYGTNLLNGRDVYKVDHDIGIRSKWVFTPSDRTKIRIIFDYTDQKSSNNATRLPVGGTAPAPYGPSYGGSPWDVSGEQPLTHFQGGGGSLRIDQDLGGVRLASISAYRRSDTLLNFDVDYTPANGRYIAFTQKDWQFSQELQLLSPDSSPIQWVAGAYYFKGSSGYDPFNFYFRGVAVPPAGPVAGLNRINLYSYHKADSVSGFGQATAPIFDGLKFTAGLRYTSEKKSLVDAVQTMYFQNGSIVPQVFPDASLHFKKLTWRLALDYQITNDTMAYISYNRGFKSGGFNANTPAIPAFSPEILDSYEAGLKTTFLDRRARLNLGAFYYDFKDLQVQRNVNGNTGVYNSGPAREYGFEGELELRPVEGLNLHATYQFIPDAEYKDFPLAVIAVTRVAGGYSLTTGSATGNRLALSPKHTLGLAADYAVKLASGELGFNAGYYYNSGFFHEPDNATRQKAYNLINASIRYRTDSGLSLSVWGNNLSNAVVANVDGVQSFGATGIRRASYAPPRTYGVTLGFDM
ncbi:TonB-dependent receptor [Sphingobium sp.]|uniref:TonB-dependent receptor n=1 Tax=Sphingobium sp. TaxID=1912891 RepID=UPI0028BDF13A|nr:TonB-dependent receptor [Sphingobium sp.]